MSNHTLSYCISPFEADRADLVASWIADRQELRWVSPSTKPPLTAEKVLAWPASDGEAFLLVPSGGESNAEPVAYAELNPMHGDRDGWWLGRFVVDPRRRGEGLGRSLLHALMRRAFEELGALRVCLVVFPDNKAAIRCYTSGGLRNMGEEHHRFKGVTRSFRLTRFEILRDEWMEQGASGAAGLPRP